MQRLGAGCDFGSSSFLGGSSSEFLLVSAPRTMLINACLKILSLPERSNINLKKKHRKLDADEYLQFQRGKIHKHFIDHC